MKIVRKVVFHSQDLKTEDCAMSFSLPTQAHWKSEQLGHKVVLAIGGGVGPSAGIGLHQKIINATMTDGTGILHVLLRIDKARAKENTYIWVSV